MSLGLFPVGDIASNYDPNPMVRLYSRGPEDKHCKTCIHIVATRYGSTRHYYKCDRFRMSHSEATDFRLKWNALRAVRGHTVTALWVTALVVALFTGATIGFLAASLLASGRTRGG